jgi:hypothetical protein
MGFSNTRDPQLRRYVELNGSGGVYVTQVLPDSPGCASPGSSRAT